MTTTANGRHPVTVRGDVRMRVRVPQNPVQAPNRAGSVQESACIRAIPQSNVERPLIKPGKIRDFVSRHSAAVGASVETSWAATEQPPALIDVARTVIPTNAGNPLLWAAGTAAGMFRLAVTAVAWLAAFAVATRLRAAVALVVTVFILAIHLIAQAI